MKHNLILFLLFTLAASLACQAQEAQNSSTVDQSAMLDSAEKAFKSYTDLIRDGKFNEAIAYYADDPRFVWVEDGQVKYDSQAQIKRAFEGISSMGKVENTFSLPRIWALNDRHVMVLTNFKTTIARGTDKEFSFSGATTVVMEQMDTGWKFISGHTSTRPANKGY